MSERPHEDALGARWTLEGRIPLSGVADGASWHRARSLRTGEIVTVFLVHGPQALEVADAARRAYLVQDPHLIPVQDVEVFGGLHERGNAQEQGPAAAAADNGADEILTVVEYPAPPAPPFAAMLAEGLVRPETARSIIGEAATGLEAARRRGLRHQFLDSNRLFVDTAQGTVTVLGVGVEAASHPEVPRSGQIASYEDVSTLVALLYRSITGVAQAIDTAEAIPRPSAVVSRRIPQDLDLLCDLTLNESARSAPATTRELIAELEPWQSIPVTLEAYDPDEAAAAAVPAPTPADAAAASAPTAQSENPARPEAPDSSVTSPSAGPQSPVPAPDDLQAPEPTHERAEGTEPLTAMLPQTPAADASPSSPAFPPSSPASPSSPAPASSVGSASSPGSAGAESPAAATSPTTTPPSEAPEEPRARTDAEHAAAPGTHQASPEEPGTLSESAVPGAVGPSSPGSPGAESPSSPGAEDTATSVTGVPPTQPEAVTTSEPEATTEPAPPEATTEPEPSARPDPEPAPEPEAVAEPSARGEHAPDAEQSAEASAQALVHDLELNESRSKSAFPGHLGIDKRADPWAESRDSPRTTSWIGAPGAAAAAADADSADDAGDHPATEDLPAGQVPAAQRPAGTTGHFVADDQPSAAGTSDTGHEATDEKDTTADGDADEPDSTPAPTWAAADESPAAEPEREASDEDGSTEDGPTGGAASSADSAEPEGPAPTAPTSGLMHEPAPDGALGPIIVRGRDRSPVGTEPPTAASPAARSSLMRDVVGVAMDEETPQNTYSSSPQPREERSRQSQWILVLGVLAVIIALVFAITTITSGLRRDSAGPAESEAPPAASSEAEEEPEEESDEPEDEDSDDEEDEELPAPEPGDVEAFAEGGNENVDYAENADRLTDGDEGSVWSSKIYQSAEYGGLKDGIGFTIDFEEESTLKNVVVTTADNSGGMLELYALEDDGSRGDKLADGEFAGDGDVELTPDDAVDTEGVVLFVAELPSDTEGGYRAKIAEVTAE